MSKLVDETRKRLSVGQVDEAEAAALPDNRPENPRGMVNFLFQSSLLGLADEAARKSFGESTPIAKRGSVVSLGSMWFILAYYFVILKVKEVLTNHLLTSFYYINNYYMLMMM